MAIPHSAYPAPFNVTRSSHVVFTCRDLAASKAFYVDALGFIVTAEDSGTLYLRGLEEACHHSLVLKLSSDTPACERLGLRVYSEDDLEKSKAYFDRASLPSQWVDVPFQKRTLHVTDPVGTPLEICASMQAEPRMIVQFEKFRAGCPHRIDHFQLLTPNVPIATEFYSQIGFRISEYIAIDDTDDIVFVFLQRKGNPHDIVFAHGGGPRLHHAAFTVPDANHLIFACDHAGRLGFGRNLEHGIGRHGPGHALFAYFRDPDGHRIELFTTHYQTMDIENEPARWNLSYMKSPSWGFPPREQWFLEASPFAGANIVQPATPPKPFTLETMLGR